VNLVVVVFVDCDASALQNVAISVVKDERYYLSDVQGDLRHALSGLRVV